MEGAVAAQLAGRAWPPVPANPSLVEAGNTCSTKTLSHLSTSRAVALTSGMAALVRQYLRDGYYPSGKPTVGDALPDPSASLVKAMMVASATPMQRIAIDAAGTMFAHLGQVPSVYQGHGRVTLSRVLRVLKDPSKDTKVRSVDVIIFLSVSYLQLYDS